MAKENSETGNKPTKNVPMYARFILGGLAGMTGTLFTQPMDMVKNRMQMSAVGGQGVAYKSSFHALTAIIKNEGVLELFNGLSAGLLRQALFTSTRLGVTTALLDHFTHHGETNPDMSLRAVCAATGGFCGSILGNPADVAMIRMTSDGRLPPAERRNYKSVFHAIHRIATEEGVGSLWIGAIPTLTWGVMVNLCQVTTYAFFKGFLINNGIFKDGTPCYFVSSFSAGLITTTITMPIDIAKTRLQNMKTINGVPEHSGMLNVIQKVISMEGVPALWKGFTPYYLRLGIHTILMLMFVEQYTKLYRVYILGDRTERRSVF